MPDKLEKSCLVGKVVHPYRVLNYSNSLVLGYGHAWLGRARIRLYILIKLKIGWYEWVIRAIVVMAIGLVTSRMSYCYYLLSRCF